ncbi:hypothetical protein A8924_0717 [Saccharopolyspora erythraea NRRL 2338]|uniref:Uncharacterized protein n=2 Tax=Saccharopolyspora erythraea TaxID=1836 RepID=A4F6J7_SACEN|nr:hypothetical protein [Saccharopolyspora erythraea]EQD85419.1 hypothetical protein N599_15030 [Saccharopolyspora erythraea D]PFG93474.1 hypothetical protein A8924_0717 [Saccharopolyspora erythraea NRRL 2338]QRK90339.1 hypothetical protein JQX30_02095 [Saccharopolyspora erythraea]CAL99671.1 hypothetical protein SACE_0322 [Saccharopolyspora erythraea NRRL 2338]
MDVAEGAGPVDRLHNLLLAMTGRVDDDAVNSARELLGTGQLDAAAEFLAGCLVAGRIPVTSTEQYQLRRVLDEARSQQRLADRLHVLDTVPDEGHRFSDQDQSDDEVVAALAPVTSRLAGVRALWCSWRVTPAGVTYGAVPRRVLLAEVGSDGSVAAAGYQLLEALRRAGVGCSVEVFSSGSDLPEYHRNALAAAHRVHLDMPPAAIAQQNGMSRARAPRVSSGGEPAGGHDLPAEPAPAPRAERPVERPVERPAPEPQPEPEPVTPPAVSEPAPAQVAAPAEPAQQAAAPAEPAPQQHQNAPENQGKADSQGNMRVPAAVDAKLTDRERNLLRKLHEELAQREQDRSGPAQGGQGQRQPESWNSTMPGGTGGFPPIGAHPSPVSNQSYNKQRP